MQPPLLFDGPLPLLRILMVAVLAYAGLVLLLRITGKRTLSKMNAFDLIVTIALGSTLSATILTPSIAIAEGLTAFAALIALQYAVTFLSVRSGRFQSLVKAEPTLLFYDGRKLEAEMLRERVSEDEILAAIREAGQPGPDAVSAVVLETDGTLSVIGSVAETPPGKAVRHAL